MVGLLLCMFHQDAAAQRRKKKKKSEPKVIRIYDVDTLSKAIPLNRQNFHAKIDKQQRGADAGDGAVDGIIYFSADDTIFNSILTKSILADVDQMQVMIENLPEKNGPSVDNQTKIRYLSAVYDMLLRFNRDTRQDPYAYRKLVSNMKDFIIACYEDKQMEFVTANTNISTLNNSNKLLENKPEVRAYLYAEMGKQEPRMMIKRLSEFADEPYADDVIAEAAKIVPNEVFNYASSTNYALSGAVKRSQDPLVQTIVRIAQESRQPLKAMPFLSDIHHNRKTIAEIDKITSDPDLFYQNLVRLKVQNEQLGGDTYTDELRYRGLKYVREMNDLHESPDAVRFRCIDDFTPEAIYFLLVYGQDEIYTSSFTGSYKRMMERMNGMKGNELLEKVHYDRFRTFIRMCAGYNVLSDFLATIEDEEKTKLMTDFIAGLEKGKEDDLEDAVDVADAFGSLNDPKLIDFLKQKVRENYERSYNENSKKGVIIYGLLATLFQGTREVSNNEEAVEQSNKLNLPPINLVQYKNLVDSAGIVYEQFFFYGDEDGKNSYASFLGNFRDPKVWKIVNSKYWATITSISGKPIVVYANLPLSEPEDEEAQKQLVDYLAANNIHPTIMVHRGHSYHLPLTLDRLAKQNRIVMLGSCGGYHNLAVVLDHSPEAHIISSKQTGAMSVNEPIIKAINDQILAGNDIDWITTWKGLDGYFAAKPTIKETFDDYVPPHKNLGAIFIKAYRREANTEEE